MIRLGNEFRFSPSSTFLLWFLSSELSSALPWDFIHMESHSLCFYRLVEFQSTMLLSSIYSFSIFLEWEHRVLILYFTSYIKKGFKAMNCLLRTALATFHKFWYSVSIIVQFPLFSNLHCGFLLTWGLFGNVFINF